MQTKFKYFYLDLGHSRKFFHAKTNFILNLRKFFPRNLFQKLANNLTRESFCSRKFLPLKYIRKTDFSEKGFTLRGLRGFYPRKNIFLLCQISMLREKSTLPFPITLANKKDISIQIHSFSTIFHNGRHFVNEFLSLSISNILGLAYYIWKSPPLIRYAIPFFTSAASALMYQVYKKYWFVYMLWERSLWTQLLNQYK